MQNNNNKNLLNLIFTSLSNASKAKTLEDLLFILADLGRSLVSADRCTIWLWDKDRKEFWSKVAHGVDEIRIPDTTGLVGIAIHNDEELIINDPYNHPGFNQNVDKSTNYITKSILVMPIKDGNHKIIGAFQAINKLENVTNKNIFDARDAERLRMAASYSGSAIGSAMMTEELAKTQREIIEVLAEAGESRSKETGLHVQRVATYSKLIAEKMGLSPEDIDLLYTASPLHDIGKIGIPDSILNKAGKLTDIEFSIMKSHTTIGNDLLKKRANRPLIKAARIVAYEHHERYDGKGYPRGLQGEEIHIFARITSVADVFDALSASRIYKAAMPFEKVVFIIREGKGTQFCPKSVDAFVECLPQIAEIQERYKDVARD